jgi:hypothetical protein
MRQLFVAILPAVLLGLGMPDRTEAADVTPDYGPPPSAYGVPRYRMPLDYGPPPYYDPRRDYGTPPVYRSPPSDYAERGYRVPPDYGPAPRDYGSPPGYSPPNGNGPPDYGLPPRAYEVPPGYGRPNGNGPPDYELPPRAYEVPQYATPYGTSPGRPACNLQWRCGPWNCGWRRVCHPEFYARPYRGYEPLPRPGDHGPY